MELPGLIRFTENYVTTHGTPPWAEFTRLPCVRYASVSFAAGSVGSDWVVRLIHRMAQDLEHPLVDVRYWPHLCVGDVPGKDNWHYDDLRVGGGRHRLFWYGADSPTRFWCDMEAPEGWVIDYNDTHLHRAQAARIAGARIFLRVSETGFNPWNSLMAAPPTTASTHKVE